MKKVFFSVVVFLASLLAFSDNIQAQTAIQFNDKLTYITDSLYKRGSAWGTAFNEAYTTKDFATLTPQRIQLEKFIDTRIAELRKMKDVKNSKAYREAMIDFLIFEKKMITDGFIPIEKLSKDATTEEIQAKIDQLQVYSAQEQDQLKKVGEVQAAYAKSNGFTIETEEQKAKRENKE